MEIIHGDLEQLKQSILLKYLSYYFLIWKNTGKCEEGNKSLPYYMQKIWEGDRGTSKGRVWSGERWQGGVGRSADIASYGSYLKSTGGKKELKTCVYFGSKKI